jgi:hypothetical protein
LLQNFKLENQEVSEDNGPWSRLVLLDFKTAYEYSTSQEESFKFLELPTNNEINKNNIPGEYELFRAKKGIDLFWIASAKGLQAPEVFYEDEILQMPEFYNTLNLDDNFFGICYVLNQKGEGYSIKLYLDEEKIKLKSLIIKT